MAESARSVLDASALLALFNIETGASIVAGYAVSSAISSVNWCEAFGKLLSAGVNGAEVRARMSRTRIAVIPFDRSDAEAAGELLVPTRAHGLSLADRACLALAARLGVPAVTADRAWIDLDVGVEIVSIR